MKFSTMKSIPKLPPIEVGETINYEGREFVITSILQILIDDGTKEPYIDFKAFLKLLNDKEEN